MMEVLRTAVSSSARPGKAHHYRPDIDGLRAIAVLPVVFYHVGSQVFGGGFVGVDVFFVISGYLIVSMLAADLDAGRFSIADFYERRIRRLFPALFAMVLVSAIVAALVLPPPGFSDFAKSLAALSLFGSNVWFRITAVGNGYFGDDQGCRVLLHTWSLAVEEQFYLIMPLALALLHRHARRWMLLWLSAIALGSFAWAQYGALHSQNFAFYMVFTRAWELLIGSLAALGLAPTLRQRWLRELAAALGVAMIAYAVFFYTKKTPFPGAAALLPCVGAYLVICAGAAGETLAGRGLSIRPLVFVGLISYSLYLWHWPIIAFADYLIFGDYTATIVAVSFLAAVLSWRFVEQPFRRRRVLATRRPVLAAGGLALAVTAVLATVVIVDAGVPQRFDAKDAQRLALNAARSKEKPEDACLNFRKAYSSAAEIVRCPIGDAPHVKTVLFWGDSHVAQLRPLAVTLKNDGVFGDRNVAFATSGGCPPARGVNWFDSYHCASFTRLTETILQEPSVDTVFYGFSAWYESGTSVLCRSGDDDVCYGPITPGETTEAVASEIRRVGRDLAARHVHFVVMLPLPRYSVKPAEYEQQRATLLHLGLRTRADILASTLFRYDFEATRAVIRAAATDAGATIYDPRLDLCNGSICPYERNGVSLYTDANHMAASQMSGLRPGLEAAFRDAKRSPVSSGATEKTSAFVEAAGR